ncbi:ELMO domain-containing protein 2 [Bacillus rossius redtenbacheri]|uniref:ELMO domain-containing protein 2 n=1 Tax=Bacillus rossius redtenbacheri TaxID=93214 RepID=UPI002FDEC043
MLASLCTLIYWYLRPFIKWFLRRTTKLCEIQRICYGERPGAPRTLKVEYSLVNSRSCAIQHLIKQLDNLAAFEKFRSDDRYHIISYATNIILDVKGINPKIHPQFVKSFGKCVELIWGYQQLLHIVESLRVTRYDASNTIHETKLLRLWTLLMPNVPLESRVTKQWQEIGFQGDDPKTDFRGMGLLGLENLIYFVEEYPGSASHVLSHSNHPQYGYAFAIVGINLTSMAYHLLKEGTAKTHVYNVTKTIPTIKTFHQLYSYLFCEFDKFWIESKPRSMMEFAFIKERFEKSVRSNLLDSNCVLRINVLIDCI